MSAPTNAEFLAVVYAGLPADESGWACEFTEPPTPDARWGGSPWSPGRAVPLGERANTYFSVATVRGGKRRKANFASLRAVVLDDIDTPPLPPTWRVQTGQDATTGEATFQVGYLLDVPCVDFDRAKRMTDALGAKGFLPNDKSGNNVVRYVRLPVGVNTKPKCGPGGFRHAVVEWEPTRRYSMGALERAFGGGQDAPRHQDAPPSGDRLDAAAAVDDVITGETLHDNLLRLAARYAAKGLDAAEILTMLRGWMRECRDKVDAGRWQARWDDLGRTVQSAVEKFAPGFAPPPDAPPSNDDPEWVRRLKTWSPKSPADLTTIVPVEFLIDGWLQQGKAGVLVAHGGCGKTTLMLILCVCVVLGRPFMGLPTRQGAALFVSLDDPQKDLDGALARVIAAMGLNLAEIAAVSKGLRLVSAQDAGMPGFAAVNQRGVVEPSGLGAWLAEYAKTIDGLKLVVLDTLRQFSGGQSNDEQVMKISIAGGTTIANATNASVILSHHTGKQGFRDGVDDMYAGSGSAAIADNSRFVWVLQPASWSEVENVLKTGDTAGEPLKLTSARGSLLVKKPDPVFLARDGFSVARVSGEKKSFDERQFDVLKAAVAAIDAGHATNTALASALRRNAGFVRDRVNEWTVAGLLERENGSERGKLIVTPRCREAIRTGEWAFSGTDDGTDAELAEVRPRRRKAG